MRGTTAGSRPCSKGATSVVMPRASAPAKFRGGKRDGWRVLVEQDVHPWLLAERLTADSQRHGEGGPGDHQAG